AKVRACFRMPSTSSGDSLTSGCTNTRLSFSKAQIDNDFDRMLVLPASEIGDARVVPIDIEHRKQISVIGPARIGRGRPASLQFAALRLHLGLVRDEPPPHLGVSEPVLLLAKRQ